MVYLHSYFYRNLILISFIYSTHAIVNDDLKVIEFGTKRAEHESIGLNLFVVLDNLSDENDYELKIIPDSFCVTSPGGTTCSADTVTGLRLDNIKKNDRKNIDIVATLLNPQLREGTCRLFIDSNKVGDVHNVMRNVVEIPFKPERDLSEKCQSTDGDPLNGCQPVDCEVYYNEIKPVYDKRKKRCVETPACVQDAGVTNTDDIPKIIYDPRTNACNYGNKTPPGRPRMRNDILMTYSISDAPSSIFNKSYRCIMYYCKYISVSVLIAVTQCCFIICIIIYLCKKLGSNVKKVVSRKFYSNRQEESVTTPLIATYNKSNMDTDTTEFKSTDQSYNVDAKLKSYRSIQQNLNKPNNFKKCVSDDILSKCVNRRNWYMKRETNIDKKDHVTIDLKEKEDSNTTVEYIDEKPKAVVKKKSTPKVQPQSTKEDSSPKVAHIKSYNMENFSEQEIICHSYILGSNSRSGSKKSASYTEFTHESEEKKSTDDKGLQAYCSDDYIDKMLSDKDIDLESEIMKYSFEEEHKEGSPTNNSKKSKASMVKRILSSIFRTRINQTGPLSDPGRTEHTVLLYSSPMYTSSDSEGSKEKNDKR